MKRCRHAPEQAVRKFREGDRLLDEGKRPAEVLRPFEIAESAGARWPNQYGGMRAGQARRLRELAALRRICAGIMTSG